ncbi:M15 family metallopeptidase [Anaerosporobacter sp.]|uniref:M15 family metallopeptidase n=1 Tax=Anaerosporobacter sp. TaxID=1872529 RepID=UPI00286F49BE|nr:D-alanyl-D-alanine carboxypeptidase family protein [Anaerosporobacter sp.]
MNKNKLVIVGIGLLLSIIVYSSFTSMSKSNNSSNDYEYYYNEEENTSSTEETEITESAPALAHNTNPTNTIPIVTNENIPINTDPESITVFVNKEYNLPEDYIPSDLIEPNILFSFTYSDEKRLLRKEAAYALENLFNAASADGYTLSGVSAYRSYARQNSIYNRNLRTKGEDYTNRYSAKPGYSEHQTGLSIDVSAVSIGNRLSESFADTKEGKWLAEHAHEYGYIIRYPQEKSDITGYAYEPWHIRYLGVELATYLYENNLTLEEYYKYTPPVKDDDSTDNYDNAIDVDEPDDDLIDEITKPDTSTPNTKTGTKTESETKNDSSDKEDTQIKSDDTSKNNDKKDSDKKDTKKDTDKDSNKDKKSDSKSDTSNKTDTNTTPSDTKKTDSNSTDNNSDSNTADTTPDPSKQEDDGKSSDSTSSNTEQPSTPEDTTNPSDTGTGTATDNTSDNTDAGTEN